MLLDSASERNTFEPGSPGVGRIGAISAGRAQGVLYDALPLRLRFP
jgi:hypothetical protein